MSSGICRLMSNDAVDLKIRVLVIGGAVDLKVVGLVITAEAVDLMSNPGWAGSSRRVAGRLDVLVFRAVLRCSVVRQYRIFFWLGLAVVGNFLRLKKRGGFGV